MHRSRQAQPPQHEYLRRRLASVPDLLRLHAAFPERYPVLLDSAAAGHHGRFDILFAFPGDRLELGADGIVRRNGDPLPGPFLDALERELAAGMGPSPAEMEPAALPFHSGWFIFLAYELVREIEPGLAGLLPSPDLPLGLAVRMPAAVIHDREQREAWLVGDAETVEGSHGQVDADVQAARVLAVAESPMSVHMDEDEAGRFLSGVTAVKQLIREGDVFQVNLSRSWTLRSEPEVDSAAVYRRLQCTNPAPFAALARLNRETTIISSSPERLVAVRGRLVSTRPIAGTYPRAADPQTDQELARELVEHPKERAEHIMLIDLERNDLGRICEAGSVRVSEFMTVESYTHVHHIVSEVGGRLRGGAGPVDVIRAVFPGGTITGCPKVRCMEIIAGLERAPRGAYTGSLGYITRDGSMDLNILIRTLVQRGKVFQVRAGAGLVADSDGQRELAETRSKARGVLRALGER